MTKPVTIIAHFTARPDRIPAAKAYLLGMIPKTTSEPGCIDYDLHQDNDTPAEFTFYETFRDRAAWDLHMAQPYIADFMAVMLDLFVEMPQVRIMTRINDGPGTV